MHVHDEVDKAFVLRLVEVVARDQDPEVGFVRAGAPHLLTGDDPGITVARRARGERGKVRAGARFAEELAPDLVAGEKRRQIALLLLVGRLGDDRRPGHAETHDIEGDVGADARLLFRPDRVLNRPEAAAAVVDGPVRRAPSAFELLAVPRATLLARVARGGTDAFTPCREVRSQPRARFRAQRILLRRVA